MRNTRATAPIVPIAFATRMSMDLNRQQKRAMRRMGAVNEQGAPVRQPVAPTQARERVGAFQYVREVRDEMRKVSWPKWPEVRRYSIIVLVAVVIVTTYVFGLDSLFGILSGWLYKD
jgi:preprotein translocase subunit SecE